MKKLILSALTLSAAPAFADDPIILKPLVDARVRWEHVDQANRINDADAVTARLRLGFEAQLPAKFTFLAEATGTLAIDHDYYDGTRDSVVPATLYPSVGDPQTIGVNRLYLQYKGLPKTVVTVGRQAINLDDQRFVASATWRDNESVYDAARVEISPIKPIKIDVSYVQQNITSSGIDATGARSGFIPGDSVLGNVALMTPIGTLTGFDYLINQDNPFRTNFSSNTLGGRFAGKHAFDKTTAITYTLSYAKQTDAKLNPVKYSANYYYGDLGLISHGFVANGGYEISGADTGASLKTNPAKISSFALQTPFGSRHRWNGWAEIFASTPATGLKDAYGSVGYTSGRFHSLTSLGAVVIYHDFRSDVQNLHYGHEWDAQITAKLKKYTVYATYANYTKSSSAYANTKRFLTAIEWSF